MCCTRPDIANAVRVLNKFVSRYKQEHYQLDLYVLWYLKGAASFGLVYHRRGTNDQVVVSAHADADHANDLDTRKSITGYAVSVDGCTVAYKSKMQGVVTDDACCAELIATAKCGVQWLLAMLGELHIQTAVPTIWCDNMGAVQVVSSVGGNHKIKCLDIKTYKVKDYVTRGIFHVKHCRSENNTADILTKPLGKPSSGSTDSVLTSTTSPRP